MCRSSNDSAAFPTCQIPSHSSNLSDLLLMNCILAGSDFESKGKDEYRCSQFHEVQDSNAASSTLKAISHPSHLPLFCDSGPRQTIPFLPRQLCAMPRILPALVPAPLPGRAVAVTVSVRRVVYRPACDDNRAVAVPTAAMVAVVFVGEVAACESDCNCGEYDCRY